MRFSVVLCTHNGERYLREQIESIIHQTRLPDELIIRDDASTDGTREILRRCDPGFPVRLSFNESRIGSTHNFERALSEARGDLIALSDQDDVWEPGKLARLEAAFEPGVGLVFSDADLIDDEGSPMGKRLWDSIGFRGKLLRQFAGEPLRLLGRGKNVVTGATMAFRGNLREFFLPIPAEWTHDGWISIVTAFQARLGMIREPLIRYRIHPRQQLGLTLARSSLCRMPEQARSYARMYESVIERVRPFADSRKLQGLESAVRHWTVRADLPALRAARLLPVVRELLADRYRRYSNGFLSAAKDLLIR